MKKGTGPFAWHQPPSIFVELQHCNIYGGVAEWFKAPELDSGRPLCLKGSNPFASAVALTRNSNLPAFITYPCE